MPSTCAGWPTRASTSSSRHSRRDGGEHLRRQYLTRRRLVVPGGVVVEHVRLPALPEFHMVYLLFEGQARDLCEGLTAILNPRTVSPPSVGRTRH